MSNVQAPAQAVQETSKKVYSDVASGQPLQTQDVKQVLEKSRETLEGAQAMASSSASQPSYGLTEAVGKALAQSETMQTAVSALKHAEELLQDVDSHGQLQTTITEATTIAKDIYSDADMRDLMRFWQEILRKTLSQTTVKGSTMMNTIQNLLSDTTSSNNWGALTFQAQNSLRDLITNQQLPDERKREILQRLREVVRSMANNPYYRQLLAQGKQLTEDVSKTAERSGVIEDTAQKAQEIKESEHVEKLQTSAKEVLESVAGARTTRMVVNDFKELLNDIQSRQEFYKNYFDTLGMLLENVLQNPDRLEDKEVQAQFSKLFDMGEAIMEQLNRDIEQHNIPEDLKEVARAASEHPAAKALAEDLNKLKSDLLSGEIINQLRSTVIPYLMQQIQELPIPPLAGTANSALGKFDYDLDNITLRTREIIPDKIKIKMENEFNLHPINLSTSAEKTILKVHVKGINAEFNNVHFKYKRTSTPHIHDDGFIDARFGGKGLRIWLHLNLLLDTNNRLRIERRLVKAHVDKIDCHVRETRHSAKIYEFLGGMWSHSLKDMVSHSIENGINKTLYQLEEGINGIMDTAYEVREGMVRIRQQLEANRPDQAKKELEQLGNRIQERASPVVNAAAESLAEAINRINIKDDKPVVYADKEREIRDKTGQSSI